MITRKLHWKIITLSTYNFIGIIFRLPDNIFQHDVGKKDLNLIFSHFLHPCNTNYILSFSHTSTDQTWLKLIVLSKFLSLFTFVENTKQSKNQPFSVENRQKIMKFIYVTSCLSKQVMSKCDSRVKNFRSDWKRTSHLFFEIMGFCEYSILVLGFW